jgi:hypothetical protein
MSPLYELRFYNKNHRWQFTHTLRGKTPDHAKRNIKRWLHTTLIVSFNWRTAELHAVTGSGLGRQTLTQGQPLLIANHVRHAITYEEPDHA